MSYPKYVTEFIGTFFLVLLIGLVSVSQNPALKPCGPLAIGLGLVMLVYMGGHISMAHYNPAVTLAFAIRGDCKIIDVGPYIVSQIAAAIAASYIVSVVGPLAGSSAEAIGPFCIAPGAPLTSAGPWIIEILFTFILVLVILHVAVCPATKGNQYYGLAIGLTVVAIAYTGGEISGGAYNPAVGLGPNLIAYVTTGDPTHLAPLWLYLTAPFVGAVLAVPVFQFQISSLPEPPSREPPSK